MPILKAEKLVKAYKSRIVVDHVSLEVTDHKIVGLLGPNGAGKTTTFYMIAGLIRPSEGRVLLNDKDITRLAMHERARCGITYLPQEPSVFRHLTVCENIQLVLESRGLTKKKAKEKALELLEDMDIAYLADQCAQSLSGGERRRVEVLRALATEPLFILLDEPFAGVDPLAISDLQDIIKTLKKRGLGILISDHNVRETLTVCDLGYIVNQGQIIEQGTPEHIANSDLARKFYLGEDFSL